MMSNVRIDPKKNFGQPHVRGVCTQAIMSRFMGGDSVALLADDYDLTAQEVEDAIRHEHQFAVDHPGEKFPLLSDVMTGRVCNECWGSGVSSRQVQITICSACDGEGVRE